MIATMMMMPEWALEAIYWAQTTLVWLCVLYQMWVVFERLVGWRGPEEPSVMLRYKLLSSRLGRQTTDD